jgi:hypothetical protein
LKSDEELIEVLKSMVPLHNQSDTTDRIRLIRAIEVARAKAEVQISIPPAGQMNAKVLASPTTLKQGARGSLQG